MTKNKQRRWEAALLLLMAPMAGSAWGQAAEADWGPSPETEWAQPALPVWGQEPAPVWRVQQPGYEPRLAGNGRPYNIRWGAGGLNVSVGAQGTYVDNVFLSHTGKKDDFVFSPVADVAAFFPIGHTNSVVLDLGLSYYQYVKNTELNTGTPLLNPNSELAFNIETGDWLFRISEAFSYQENPVYDTGGEFINVYNTGRFARYDNRVGASANWDLNQLVLSAAYYHDNLWANGSEFNYIDHASELANVNAMLALTPTLTAGLETAASYNRFDPNTILDSWRARGGPGFRFNLSKFLKARLGGGYERIQYTSGEARDLGIDAQNTFYAYAGIDHEINQFWSHSLQAVHDNQLGYNAGNLEETLFTYSLNWKLNRALTLSPLASLGFYRESFDAPSANLYNERFTYVFAGLSALYQVDRHWQGRLSWEYRLKDSGTPAFGYQQNRVTLEVQYLF
jgi:hypothetical protein